MNSSFYGGNFPNQSQNQNQSQFGGSLQEQNLEEFLYDIEIAKKVEREKLN